MQYPKGNLRIFKKIWKIGGLHSQLCTFPQCLSFGLWLLWFGIVWCWRPISCFRYLASLPYMSIRARVVIAVTFQQVFVLRVSGDVKFVAVKRPYALHLQDALAAVHHRQSIGWHQFFAAMSSEESILFAFSYTESCRYSINMLNWTQQQTGSCTGKTKLFWQ